MVVREATPADVPAILALDGQAPSAAHWGRAEYQRIVAEPTGRVVLIAEKDHSVEGFLVARRLGPEWELENIAVANSYRRRGVGTILLQELLEMAYKSGAQAVYLEVRESNTAARGLYSKLGFAEVGRRKVYYQRPEEDALAYKKSFPQSHGKDVEGAGKDVIA